MRKRMADRARKLESWMKPKLPFIFYPLRAVYRLVYPIFTRLIFFAALSYFYIEYFFLLLFHCFRLRKATHVCPRWYWTFGHQALETHMLALRFREQKLLILLSDFGGYNNYLIDSFKDIVDICKLRHSPIAAYIRRSFFDDRDRKKLYKLTWRITRLFLIIVGNRKAEVVETFNKPGTTPLSYATEYLGLLNKYDDLQVKPPECPIIKFKGEFKDADKWFVSIYLRNKGDVRDTEPTAYRACIERITELGGVVFIGGDYDPHELFPDVKHLYGYKDFDCDRSVSDIFFLTQSTFVICGHSAPVAIASTFRTPTLISNCSFYDHSGFRKEQHVLYKSVKNTATGKNLSARELFNPPVINFQGKQIRSDIEVRDNNSEELLKAVNEMIERYHLSNYEERADESGLIERFRSIVPQNSWVSETPSVPMIDYLRSLDW